MSTWRFLARERIPIVALSPLKPHRIFPPQNCECVDDSAEDWSCADPKHQGDGYCDDANNVAECGFDLGDCCEYADTEDWDAFCQQCICKKP